MVGVCCQGTRETTGVRKNRRKVEVLLCCEEGQRRLRKIVGKETEKEEEDKDSHFPTK